VTVTYNGCDTVTSTGSRRFAIRAAPRWHLANQLCGSNPQRYACS
jgi:hypothetical protein